MLTLMVFGILVPPLLLLGPLSSWLNMRALIWTEKQIEQRMFGEDLAERILVQYSCFFSYVYLTVNVCARSPTFLIRNLAHLGNLFIILFVFVESVPEITVATH